MSTRGSVIINDKENERVIGIYSHMDANIHRGLGSSLFAFLANRDESCPSTIRTGNGNITLRTIKTPVYDVGDLGAQLVTYLKKSSDRAGDVYIMRERENIASDCEYVYYITPLEREGSRVCSCCGQLVKTASWLIEIDKDGSRIFTGSAEEAIKHFGKNPSKPLY